MCTYKYIYIYIYLYLFIFIIALIVVKYTYILYFYAVIYPCEFLCRKVSTFDARRALNIVHYYVIHY